MTTVEVIERDIEHLSQEELAEFRRWFAVFDADAWDAQIEADAASGKPDAPAGKSLTEHEAGEITGESDEIIQMMVRAGLMNPRRPKHASPPDPVSEEERVRLAEKLGQAPGRPLSEIIISERDQ